MTVLSPRLIAAQCLRRLALANATDTERCRVLVAELAGLVRAYYVRGEMRQDVPGDEPIITIITEQVTPVRDSALVAWWSTNADSLVGDMRDIASGLLGRAGVSVV